jgi:hypothetical protein
MWVGAERGLEEPIPLAVLEDLWAIACSHPSTAIARWSRLRISQGSVLENTWRREMLASRRFMALSRDLARNFLVLTPLIVERRRRVLKFSYQEVTGIPRVKVTPRLLMDRKSMPPRRPSTASVGKGTVLVASSWVNDTGAITSQQRRPLPNVSVHLAGSTTYTVRTGVDGTRLLQADIGSYRVSYTAPEGAFIATHVDECKLTTPGEQVHLALDFLAGPHFKDDPPFTPRLSVRQKLLRAATIHPKPIEIRLPSIGQCHSYHVQFETADGFHIVEAGVRYLASVVPPGTEPLVRTLGPSRLTPLQQRVGLYAAGVPLDRIAAATFSVRPRPSMIVRAAFLAAILGCVGILITLLWRESVTVSPGPWVALLVIVPAGLSAYVGRIRENLFATEVLIGLRGLAFLSALCSAAAAVVVILSRELTPAEPADDLIGTESPATRWMLVLLLALNAIVACALFIAWRRAQNPPEFRGKGAVNTSGATL